MIQETIRKHRYVFAGVVFGPIILTFIFWGGSCGTKQPRGAEDGGVLGPVATVEDMNIDAVVFREQLDEEARRRSQYNAGETPSLKELAMDGTAERVFENLVNEALLRADAEKQPLKLEREFLVEKLKEDSTFQDETGKFSAEMWNKWLDANPQVNWNALYAGIESQLQQYAAGQRITASARVRESDLRKRFEEENTKFKLKTVAVEPPIEPTEEEIRAQYDRDPMVYALPEERVAEYVAFSMTPPKPKLVDEVLDRAKKGEDFGKLAETYSQMPDKEQGGDMGWVALDDALPEHQKPLVDLAVGAVSEPVEGPGGFYVIYKVEEERTAEATNTREVHARQIVIMPALTDEERAAVKSKADALAAAAREKGSLEEAAKAEGLNVQTTSPFTEESLSIEPLPVDDVRRFRMDVSKVAENELSAVVECQKNLYVARVTKVQAAVEQPFEAVQERVKADAIEEIRRSPDYAARVRALADEIKGNASSLAQIQELRPDLKTKIEEPPEFSVKDFPYSDWMVRPQEVAAVLKDKAAGAFAGPVMDYMGRKAYFVELVEKTPPTEADWKDKWPEEEKQMREMALMMERRKRIEDYLKDRSAQGGWKRHDVAIAEVLGLNEPEDAEGVSAEEAPAEGVSAEGVSGEGVSGEGVSGEETSQEAGAKDAAGSAEAVAADAAPAEETAAPAEQ